jgi:hypothetical protein
MSHFFTVAILPSETSASHIEPALAKLMAPFDENISVDTYQAVCGCKGREAIEESKKIVENQYGTMDSIGKKFREELDYEIEHDEMSRLWKKAITPYMLALKIAVNKHPKKNTFDSKCSLCHGRGRYPSTYNPRSKWDWYVIGGRYDGEIQNKAPSSFNNRFNFGINRSRLAYNVIRLPKGLLDIQAYAIVTPDGKWHQKGDVEWFGMATKEKSEQKWQKVRREIFTRYVDHLAVGVDCHI